MRHVPGSSCAADDIKNKSRLSRILDDLVTPAQVVSWLKEQRVVISATTEDALVKNEISGKIIQDLSEDAWRELLPSIGPRESIKKFIRDFDNTRGADDFRQLHDNDAITTVGTKADVWKSSSLGVATSSSTTTGATLTKRATTTSSVSVALAATAPNLSNSRKFSPCGESVNSIKVMWGKQPKVPFKSCAIVFNSGVLLDSGKGSEIDAHDVVFRINYAPTHPFGSDVGLKTSICVSERNLQQMHGYFAWAPEHTYNMSSSGNTIFLHIHADSLATERKYFNGAKTLWQLHYPYRCESNVKKAWSDWSGRGCTSGLKLLQLTLSVCAHTSLFGVRSSPCHKHHYYDDHDLPDKSKCALQTGSNQVYYKHQHAGFHDFDAEHALVEASVHDEGLRKKVTGCSSVGTLSINL